MSAREVFIAIPAWGREYVNLAVRYTIPATLAALRAWRSDYAAHFLVHTYERDAFAVALRGQHVEYRDPQAGPGHDGQWVAFKQAHRDAIAWAPQGALLALLNSDIVVSIETFAAVDAALQGKKTVGVSVGIRTLIDGNVPPIGADAETLSHYIWAHRHPITEECIWGSGRTHHPTILFFGHTPQAPTSTPVVSMHCFHLTPMFIIKDRPLDFKGTIDDDVLEAYGEDQVVYFNKREFAVCELSPANKRHPARNPLNVAEVVEFGRQRFRGSHVRNFRQRFAVLGNADRNHQAADAILEGLKPHFPQ